MTKDLRKSQGLQNMVKGGKVANKIFAATQIQGWKQRSKIQAGKCFSPLVFISCLGALPSTRKYPRTAVRCGDKLLLRNLFSLKSLFTVFSPVPTFTPQIDIKTLALVPALWGDEEGGDSFWVLETWTAPSLPPCAHGSWLRVLEFSS